MSDAKPERLRRVLENLPPRGLYLVAPDDDGKGFTMVFAYNPGITLHLDQLEGETLEQAAAWLRSVMPKAEIQLPS